MKLSPLALAVALAATGLLTAGCERGIGLSSDTSQSADSGRKSDLSRTKTLSGGTSAKVTSSLPAAQALGVAYRDIVDVAGIDPAAHVFSVRHGGALFPVEPLVKRLSALPPVTASAVPRTARDVALSALAKAQTAGPEAIRDFAAHALAAANLLAASWPEKSSSGIAGESADLYSRERSFNDRALDQFVRSIVALSNAAGSLPAAWLTGLAG